MSSEWFKELVKKVETVDGEAAIWMRETYARNPGFFAVEHDFGLQGAFSWYQTPQGYEFWREVSVKLAAPGEREQQLTDAFKLFKTDGAEAEPKKPIALAAIPVGAFYSDDADEFWLGELSPDASAYFRGRLANLKIVSPDRNVETIRDRLLNRSEVGLKKYGVTTAEANLTPEQWARHLQEELLDAAVYVEALLSAD